MTNEEATTKYKGHGWLLVYSEGALVVQKDDSMNVFKDDTEASDSAYKAGVPIIEYDGIYYVNTKENILLLSFSRRRGDA